MNSNTPISERFIYEERREEDGEIMLIELKEGTPKASLEVRSPIFRLSRTKGGFYFSFFASNHGLARSAKSSSQA